VLSRSEGRREYSKAEGPLHRTWLDPSLTAKEAFKEMAPDLVRARERIKEMDLEELGLVEQQHATTNILEPGFKHLEIVSDARDMMEPLSEHLDAGTGAIVFRVVAREGRLARLRREALGGEDGGEEAGGGAGAGGGSGGGGGQQGGGGEGGGGSSMYARLLVANRLIHLPTPKATTKARGNVKAKAVEIGRPSSELAFNDAVACLRAFGIGFPAQKVGDWGLWL
jgi:hypothetical protein